MNISIPIFSSTYRLSIISCALSITCSLVIPRFILSAIQSSISICCLGNCNINITIVILSVGSCNSSNPPNKVFCISESSIAKIPFNSVQQIFISIYLDLRSYFIGTISKIITKIPIICCSSNTPIGRFILELCKKIFSKNFNFFSITNINI